jgi:tetratricopeptide (TPR) repeat protein
VTNTPLRQAILDFSAGRPDSARRACRELLALAPEHAGALHLLGLISHQDGDLAQAEQLLRGAAESPDATALHCLSYAELCCKPVDLERAIAVARRAVAIDATSVLGWFCLGNWLRDAEQLESSRDCYQKALGQDPTFWQARANHALVLARLGAAAQGVDELERLLADRPGNVELHTSLAALLQDLGRYEQAAHEAQQAAQLEPEALEPRLRLAEIEMQRGRYSAALAALHAGNLRWQDDPRRIALEAHVLRHLDQNETAAALCRNAVTRGIESPELLRAYGLAAQSARQEMLALELFDRAAARSAVPRARALALSDKGLLLAELGRPAEAAAAFAAAVQRAPALAEAWYQRANAKAYAPGDPDIGAMERLLHAGAAYRDRLLLHFALGKAQFDAGRIDAAFRHWHEGNRLKRASIDYDPLEASRQMTAIAAQPPVESAWRAAAGPRLSELPVFIVGMPRSGSTLVEQILSSHPDICGGGELMQLRSLFAPVSPATPGAPAEESERQADSPDRLAAAALERLTRASTQALRVVDKDLGNFLHLGTIHRLFPRARIIHCRRDPLETCFSAYTRLFFGSYDFAYQMDELGRYYRDYHVLMRHWRSALPGRVFLEIDYETLVEDPERETRRLLDFLGVAWSDRCLRFFDSDRAVGTSSAAQVRRPIYRSSLNRTLPLRTQLQPLIAALGDLAAAGAAPGCAP